MDGDILITYPTIKNKSGGLQPWQHVIEILEKKISGFPTITNLYPVMSVHRWACSIHVKILYTDKDCH